VLVVPPENTDEVERMQDMNDLQVWTLLVSTPLEIIFDLPIGFPINNIISLYSSIWFTQQRFLCNKNDAPTLTLAVLLGKHATYTMAVRQGREIVFQVVYQLDDLRGHVRSCSECNHIPMQKNVPCHAACDAAKMQHGHICCECMGVQYSRAKGFCHSVLHRASICDGVSGCLGVS